MGRSLNPRDGHSRGFAHIEQDGLGVFPQPEADFGGIHFLRNRILQSGFSGHLVAVGLNIGDGGVFRAERTVRIWLKAQTLGLHLESVNDQKGAAQ